MIRVAFWRDPATERYRAWVFLPVGSFLATGTAISVLFFAIDHGVKSRLPEGWVLDDLDYETHFLGNRPAPDEREARELLEAAA